MRNLLFAISALLIITACSKVPYTERHQFMIVSEEQEEKIGAVAFTQVKQESRIDQEPRVNSEIKTVGERIAAAAEKPDYKWEFVVIEDKTANAFALPGGKVAVYTGILPLAKDEAGLAAVMGHEVAHVLARHGAERMSQQQLLQVGEVALFAGLSGNSPAIREGVLQAYGLGAQVGVLLPYSRKHESEADRIGLILMSKAGYDPRAALDFWRRMIDAEQGPNVPQFLSTHPSDRTRLAELETHLPEAMEYYKKALASNPQFNRPPKPL